VVEDVQGLPPVCAGRVRVPGGIVRVAEVSEDVSLVEPVALVAKHLKGPPVAGQGLAVITKVIMGVADAVPCGGLALLVAELPVQVEGLAGHEQALPVVAELGMAPADVVQRPGLPPAIPELSVDGQGQLALGERLAPAALRAEQGTHVHENVSLGRTVTELAVKLECLYVFTLRVVNGAEQPLRMPYAVPHPGLRLEITEPLCCGQARPLEFCVLPPVAAPVQEGCHHRWQLPGVLVEARADRRPNHGVQHVTVGLIPG
jgi:hypothetical protein